MNKLRVLGMGLVAVLAFGAMGGSDASAKQALVLKEEGVPVPAGAELELELEAKYVCTIVRRAHVTRNSAAADEVTIEPGKDCEQEFLYPESLSESGSEIAMTSRGWATVRGPLYYVRHNPDPVAPDENCTYAASRLRGRFQKPGHADMRVSGRDEVIAEYGRGGRKCARKSSLVLSVRILGHNGAPLETEIVG